MILGSYIYIRRHINIYKIEK